MTSTIGELTEALSLVGADMLEVEIALANASQRATVETLAVAISANLDYGALAAALLPLLNPTLDHGELAGLVDDDHEQYHNDTRGDIRYARLAGNNTLTGALTIAPPTGFAFINLAAADNGNSNGGVVSVDMNNNGTNPAGGSFRVRDKANTWRTLWSDATGVWRTGNSLPTSATDTTGTVVGAQTSSLDSKDVQEGLTEIDDVLLAVAAGAEAVRRFVYKSGAINGQEFEGVITDFSPRYGMDRDDEHPAGKSLNVITAIGDLLRAVDYLAGEIAALKAA